VYVPDTNSANVSYIETWSPANFTETGLPIGTAWRVNITGGLSYSSDTPNLSFEIAEGSFTYATGSNNPLFNSPGGNFTVNGTGVSQNVVFTQVRFPVNFIELGLPGSIEWSVELSGRNMVSAKPMISFDQPDGVYQYAVGGVPGWTTSTWSSSISVSGRSVSVDVPWTRAVYPVLFTEIGLPSGTGWWANVSLTPSTFSANSTLSVIEPNGTYSYSIASQDLRFVAPGSAFTVNGTGFDVAVTFEPVTFSVNFTEIGLPNHANWSVTVGTETNFSLTSTIQVPEPNGTYVFSVTPKSGFAASPASGTVSVEGGNTTQSIVFWVVGPTLFSVTFTEKGLPAGENWSLTFHGTANSGSGAIVFQGVANGSYRFTVTPVGEYSATPSSGSVLVNGSSASRSVEFSAQGSSTTPSGGLTSSEQYLVVGAFVAAIAGGVTIGFLRVRRKPSPPSVGPRP
jgi:hypothetical protein